MKILTDVVNGLKWIGAEAAKAIEFVPKVVKITEDVKQDAGTLLPAAVQVFTDVEQLGLAAVKDGGAMVSSLQVLGLSIAEAASAKLTNISEDEAVIAAFKAVVVQAETSGNWVDVMNALATLTKSWDEFGAASKAALAQIEADATG